MRKSLFLPRKADGSDEAPINLTPLIDVVFVVLIMFMVIAPILEMDGIELACAAPSSQEISAVEQSHPITIQVDKDNAIWVHSEKVSGEKLIAYLQQARKTYPQATPLLFQDKRAQFGTYQEVKRAAELAGFVELDVVLSPRP